MEPKNEWKKGKFRYKSFFSVTTFFFPKACLTAQPFTKHITMVHAAGMQKNSQGDWQIRTQNRGGSPGDYILPPKSSRTSR
jgi:hypothetical protein